jgi:FkbM family methyltransferase
MNHSKQEIRHLIRTAEACLEGGRFGEALEHTAKLLAVAPGDYAALTLHGKALRRAGRAEESLKFFGEAFKTYPPRLEDLHQLMIALVRVNRLEDAAKCAQAIQASARAFGSEAGGWGAYANFLLEGKTIAEVPVDGEVLRFHVYPGRENQGESVIHAAGKLCELEELTYIRERVASGGFIVDVGANIGNHLVYFARFLKPRVLLPIEPMPEAVRQLRENIALNRIECVDERYLGAGAGERRQRMTVKPAQELVSYGLVPSDMGEIEVFPLDEIIDAPAHFIKIDVEGMELEVLRGARRVLARSRPLVLIELADDRKEEFERLLGEIGYAVERSFPGRGYRNYFIAPRTV